MIPFAEAHPTLAGVVVIVGALFLYNTLKLILKSLVAVDASDFD